MPKPSLSSLAERLSKGIAKFQPILAMAKAKDVNESDTVIIVQDMMCEVFGYDKYNDLTSEYCIRGTYCDLATKSQGKIELLIEIKSIGTQLKTNHIRQAVDYAVRQGVEWVLLTNGQVWQVHHISFAKPVTSSQVLEVDFSQLDPHSESDLGQLYLWCKESWEHAVMGDYHHHQQALSHVLIGQVLISDPVVAVVRRELRRVNPNVKITMEQVRHVMKQEVIKRDALEGEGSREAALRVLACEHTLLKHRQSGGAIGADDDSHGHHASS